MNRATVAAADVVRRHIDAFNAHDLDRLLACFADDVRWVTGDDRFEGKAELARLFSDAFTGLGPHLEIATLVADEAGVACELSEEYAVRGERRVVRIAAFYRVENGVITRVKVYREGSADADD